ncbi:MAG: pantoate--beta-alanine ligase [Phycisphaerales bacterium]|nr:pantoate--beta-alanine ligase [Phycisphaerales bacterium]
MRLHSSLGDFRAYRASFEGGCVVVPTMGALHAGHAALIRAGVALARERHLSAGCIVTVFVNPTQFNDPADLEKYPRNLEADAALCRQAGADCVLAPSVHEVYPKPDFAPMPSLPAVAAGPGLEEASRPGHFQGVCQVVNRLFEITGPRCAVFGEKDWQQLQVVRAMSPVWGGRPVEVASVPTVREPDGLAMSSRNAQLPPSARRAAAGLASAFVEAAKAKVWQDAERAAAGALGRTGAHVEYVAVREPSTLMPLPPGATEGRILWAVRLGGVRLIDNAPWRAVSA